MGRFHLLASAAFARVLAMAFVVLTMGWPGHVLSQEEAEEALPYAFEVGAINSGLDEPEQIVLRDTPRAALESFLTAIEDDKPGRAAHVLNLNAIPEEDQAERAPGLALMLAYALHHRDLIDWSEVPDEPDARVLPGLQSSVAPYGRRTIELGEIMLDGRPVSVNLQRYQAEDAGAVWLFSPTLVEDVPALYQDLSEGWFGDWIPVDRRLDLLSRASVLEWAIAVGILVASGIAWLAVFGAALLLARRLSPEKSRWLARTAVPLAIFFAALVLRTGVTNIVLLTGPLAANLDIGSEIALLLTGAWLLLRLLSALTLWLSETFVVPLATEDPENRKTKTTVYVVRRLSLVIMTIFAVGYVLVNLGAFETFGLSLLVSAGTLGVLLAIAAQPLLGNMVAGMQIALTDPVRIGDTVTYNDHWGTVEDISFAHLVIRTETDTRLIVPHGEFLSRAFENWSKEGEPVRRIVKIPVDYEIDMDLLRNAVADIVDGDPRLMEPPLVELVEADANAATVWIWIMSTDGSSAWYLHNEVREKVLAFLREKDGGRFLPRRRYRMVDVQ